MLVIAWAIIFFGIYFILSGTIAIMRFKGFYAKLHAASVTECCAIPMILFGLALMQTEWVSCLKLILIAIIILVINPLSTYALAQASINLNMHKDQL